MKKMLFVCLALLGIVGSSSYAHATALLVAGDYADAHRFGLWYNMSGHTYVLGDASATSHRIDISQFSFLASFLTGANRPATMEFNTIIAGGTITHPKVTSADLSFYNSSGELLLRAQGVPNSTLVDIIHLNGVNGQLDIFSTLNVTGGSLFTSGLVNGTITANVDFNNVLAINKYKDIHFSDGNFSISYNPKIPPNEIPEPATSVLLLSSLAGIVARRKKAKGIKIEA